jgi:hypothetical protein
MPKQSNQPTTSTPRNPLVEVFGFPLSNKSEIALHYQTNKLCPYNNVVPSCTKVSVLDPLGVCSLYDKDGEPTIICPVRFKEVWIITADAASFFFPKGTSWTALPEVRLTDSKGNAAGNVDIVLVAYDEDGFVTDFGALEIQAVYISGNMRRPFNAYRKNLQQTTFDWTGQKEYPRPDYLSSSRKRLAPQLIYKGGIFKAWNKKQAVAIDRKFFETLPPLMEVAPRKADIVWLVYDLAFDAAAQKYHLAQHKVVYTEFAPALDTITKSEAGPLEDFIKILQGKLKKLQTGKSPNETTIEQALTE